MAPALHDFDLFLPELRKICVKYYSEEDAWFADEGARVFVTSDHMSRNSPIKKALCTSSPEQYFRFRVTDDGVDFWMKMSYQNCRNREFIEHTRSGLAARIATRGLAIVNDLYSYDREKSLGQITNCFHLCDVESEADFYSFFESRLNNIIEDVRCMKAFDDVTQHILLNLIYGNFIWTTTSRRYKQAVNNVNSRIQ